MNIEKSIFIETANERAKVENFCRSYLISKQGSVNESDLQRMVDRIANDIYIHVKREHVNKEFVKRFSTKTGNKCKDGQIEVTCNACGAITSHGCSTFWKHIQSHVRNNHVSFGDMLRKWNYNVIETYLSLSNGGESVLQLPSISSDLRKRDYSSEKYRKKKSARNNCDNNIIILTLGVIETSASLSSLLNSTIFQSAVYNETTGARLLTSVLPKLSDISHQFIIQQLRDSAVTLLFEDYTYHHTILYRICITNGEETFFWKWLCLNEHQKNAGVIASIIQNEVSVLSEDHIQVTGFASSNSKLMHEVIGKELLKKQLYIHPVPYVSFMIEDIFRELFSLPKIQEIWSNVKPINDFFCSHRKYMHVLMEYQNLFPSIRYDMDKLVKWKNPLLMNVTGNKLLVTTKTGNRVCMKDLLTISQFFEDYEEDDSDMIQEDLILNSSNFTICNSLFLLDSRSQLFYSRYFVLLRFLETFNAIVTSLEFIKVKSSGSTCIDAERVRKFSLPEGCMEIIRNVLAFLHPFIQLLEYALDKNSKQENIILLMNELMSFLKTQSFSFISQEEIQQVVLSRGDIITPPPTNILALINYQYPKPFPEKDKPFVVPPELDEELNKARYEAYGIIHGSYDNYDSPDTPEEVEHRKQANQVKEELILYIRNYVEHMGVNVDFYLEHSQFQLLNSIVKRVKRRASNQIEQSFFSFDSCEMKLCSQERESNNSPYLTLKGILSCFSRHPELMSRFIHFIEQNLEL